MQAIGLELKDGYANPMPSTRLEGVPKLGPRRSTVTELVEASESPVIGRRLSEIEEEPITWLWSPFIPLGMFTLIDGEEGIGKTWVTLAIAAAVSTGRGLHGVSGEDHLAAGNVLLIAPEDSAAQVIKPRLRQAGADMTRIFVEENPISLNSAAGIVRFTKGLDTHGPRLVIFDPIFACVGGIDLNQDNQIRTVTSQLKSLAEQYNCAMVGVRHIGKSKGQGEARNAGLGGVAWRASARSNVLIGKNPEDDRERAMVQIKSNLLPETPQAIGYTITGEGLHWTGPSKLTAAQMLSFKPQETHEDRSAREVAVDFLRDFLGNGPKARKEIETAAKEIGISDATLRRAQYQVCAKPQKRGLGPWEWSLK